MALAGASRRGQRYAVLVAPGAGAAAVLTFGGLAARLAGPRWAPLAALALAVTLPEQYTSRSSLSEPLAQILFLGGLCLVIDSLTAEGAMARVSAGLGGLALGLTILVRIDGISDILPVVPYAALLLIEERPQAVPLVCGMGLGAIAGVADGVLLSWPYLMHNKGSVLPLAVLAALVTILAACAAVPLLRRHRLPAPDWSGRRGRWLLGVAAALPFAVLAALAAAPVCARGPVGTGRPAAQPPGDHQGPPLPAIQPALGGLVPGRARPAARGGRAAILARRCLRGDARPGRCR